MSIPAVSAPEARLSLSVSSLASAFFGAGFAMILLEAVFIREMGALANSSYGTRAIIGFHLFFSEIWFIFVGNVLVALLLVKQDFRIERRLIENAGPPAVIVAVYAIWFVYGSLAGNGWALQEFREMVFNALCLPAVFYFAARTDVGSIFKAFVLAGLPIVVVASLFGAHNSVLILASSIVAYFTFRVLYGRPAAIPGLLLALLPFFVRFEKPTIALLAFTLMGTSLFAAHLNPQSRNWILSKFKLRMIAIAIMMVIAGLLLAVAVNALTEGLIEDVIRFHFLKIRFNSAGEIQQGDLSGGRLAIWAAALDGWQNRFLFGHGLGASVKAFSAGWVTKVQFHNYAVQALHNTGVIGTALILGALIRWFRNALRQLRQIDDLDSRLIFACMLVYVAGVLFYGSYGHSLSSPPTAQLFWVCVGVFCVVKGNREAHAR